MATRMKFTEEQKQEVAHLYESGLTVNDIMRLMGVSSTPIRRLLRDADVTPRAQGDDVKKSRNQKILELNAENKYTLDEIGKAVGVTRQRVHQIIARGY